MGTIMLMDLLSAGLLLVLAVAALVAARRDAVCRWIWIGTALFCVAGGVFYLVISPIHEARIRNEAMR